MAACGHVRFYLKQKKFQEKILQSLPKDSKRGYTPVLEVEAKSKRLACSASLASAASRH
jgi:hypothetical protein